MKVNPKGKLHPSAGMCTKNVGVVPQSCAYAVFYLLDPFIWADQRESMGA